MTEDEIEVCPVCLYVHLADETVCPHCGATTITEDLER